MSVVTINTSLVAASDYLLWVYSSSKPPAVAWITPNPKGSVDIRHFSRCDALLYCIFLYPSSTQTRHQMPGKHVYLKLQPCPCFLPPIGPGLH